jgi:hypothetical protein
MLREPTTQTLNVVCTILKLEIEWVRSQEPYVDVVEYCVGEILYTLAELEAHRLRFGESHGHRIPFNELKILLLDVSCT